MNLSRTLSAIDLINDLKKMADSKTAFSLSKYYKTGVGEYAENDKFLGIRVPVLHRLERKYQSLTISELEMALTSEFHEIRMLVLFILVNKYKKALSDSFKEEVYNLFIRNTEHINNWDLIDFNTYKVIGDFVYEKGLESVLISFAESESMWERRIAIVSTLFYIKKNSFELTLEISKILLNDKQDLIHKAVGWMLREVGKRDLKIMKSFLEENIRSLPRTSLRYAIEKLPKPVQKYYLNLP
jgi:3-methyladenine DNA glycosylase AlkD